MAKKVLEVAASELVRSSMEAYAKEVIEDRSLPDFRDGLKISQRRILYYMWSEGLTSTGNFKASANVVGGVLGKLHPHGDCLKGDTLVYSLDGTFRKIEDIVRDGVKELWVLAYDSENGITVPTKAHSFRVGQYASKIYKVILSDGSYIECTGNHPFFITEKGWVKAHDLKNMTLIEGGQFTALDGRPDIRYAGSGAKDKKGGLMQDLSRLSGNDYVIHHINGNPRDNTPENLKLLSRGEHAKEHKDYLSGLDKGRSRMFSDSSELRDGIKIKNSCLMAIHNENLWLVKAIKIINLIKKEGKIPTEDLYEAYRNRIYNGTTLNKVMDNGVTFPELVERAESGWKPDYSKSKGRTYKQTVTSVGGGEDLRKCSQLSMVGRIISKVITQGSEITHQNFSDVKYELGCVDAKYKFSLTWDGLEKTLGTSDLDEVISLLPSRFLLFIKAVEVTDLTSLIPMYDFTVDKYHNMLVPSTLPNHLGEATFVVAHNSSCYDTLVNLNRNIIAPVQGDGDGWGDIHTEASAMRYTKTRLSSFGERFCSDLHVSEWIPNYSGDWQEPIIIPAPIPFALLAGTSGIAVAVATSIPSHNLTELVNTFVAVLKGEQDIDKLVGTTLLAPESKTGGVVVSTLDELREMYQKGKGRVRWRCGYEMLYDKKNTEWSLIITSIPEAFPLASWLTKMKVHAQTGMVRIENESCANDPIRFVVTFDNVAFFYDVIEPSLYCNDNYSFNIIAKRGERAVDISLQHHSLLSWIDAWLTWREDVEIKIIKAQIAKLEKDLYREETKYWAAENIDAIVLCLKASQNPAKDLKFQFKLEDQQVKIIVEMQLQSISKLSKDKQSKTIKSLRSELDAENKKLKQPKQLVENTLKSLLPFDTKGRIAKIDYGDSEATKSQKALKKSEGKPNYWAIETTKPKTLHMIGAEIPFRKRVLNPYTNVVNAQQGLITVTEKGEIKRWSISDLVEKDIGYPYVAILSPHHQQLILSLNNGLWGNYAMEQKASAWTTKLIHTGDDKVLSALGLDKGDTLWVYSTSHLDSVCCNWEPMTRANKTGWKVKGGKEIRLLAIPKGYSISIDSKVYPFTETQRPTKDLIQKFLMATSVYMYNPNDDKRTLLCIGSDGTRYAMTGKDIATSSLELIQTYLI